MQSLLRTSWIAKCPPVQFLLLAFWHSDLTLADSRNSLSICQANRYFLFFLVCPVLLQLMGLDIQHGLSRRDRAPEIAPSPPALLLPPTVAIAIANVVVVLVAL